MDFLYSDDQNNIKDLVTQIFETEVTDRSLEETEKDDVWLHRELWEALQQADLLGIAIPLKYGGSGMGLTELGLLLEAQGRTAAPIPLMHTLVLGALGINKFGSQSQKEKILPLVCRGEYVVSAALSEKSSPEFHRPSTMATKVEGGWLIKGEKIKVPLATVASVFLVPVAISKEKPLVLLVSPDAEGITLKRQKNMTGEPVWQVELDNVFVQKSDVLGELEQGCEILRWLADHTLACLCAMQLGASKKQLELLAKHASSREQFGQAIAQFQAVSQRAADAYIDVESLNLCYLQAIWRLSQGLECRRELLIAKYWAAETGHRVSSAAQHIHGGIGVDRDYPLYRFTLLTKELEFTMGGSNHTLAKLGELLSDSNFVVDA